MRYLFILVVFAGFLSCSSPGGNDKLPYIGRIEVDENSGDTTYHTIADFKLMDQDSNWVTNEDLSSGIYVADFFFTSCPDICPMMKTQMLRVYETFKDEPSVRYLSHTIDPERDTPAVLKDFSDRIGVDNSIWKFVTAEIDYMYKLGQTSYMAPMASDAQTGFTHSGRFFLIDKERRIRGYYDGTDPASVDFLIADIPKLLKEYE